MVEGIMAALMGGFVATLLVGLYFLPTIIAGRKRKKNIGGIAVINVFLGWTFVGWVVALAWAVCDD